MNNWRSVWTTTKQQGARIGPKRKVSRISGVKLDEEDAVVDEPVSTVMVVIFVLGVAWYLWHCYSDYFYSLAAFCVSDLQQCVHKA